MTRLRVAVNLTWLAPGRVGGSEQYLERQLMGLPNEFDVTLFCQPTLPAEYPALAERYEIKPMPVERDSRALRIALEHSWLARGTRSFDLVHHGGGTMPLRAGSATLLTVHDLQYRLFPHYFSAPRRRYLEAMMPRSAQRADLIATPTAYVRRTVVESFGVHPDRVAVVPHGIPNVTVPHPDVIAATRRRYGADARYVVYPAITHPHKGHGRLLDMLLERDDDLAVVMVGGVGEAEADLRARIDREGLRERVIRTGRVDPHDRDALVAGAEALVFPSEYEGFGAPLVEAMQLGVPVVSSDTEAVREVVGGAAVVVTDGDWSAAIDEAIVRRPDLVAAGHARRAAFTLEASGQALADAYHRAGS